MRLSLQSFTTLVQNMAASVQAAASDLIDLSVGSTLRAVLEANASVGLWMQWLILQVLQTTRAATSTGGDLDTWMADMSLSRLPALAASGSVTFSRYSPVGTALVPAGTLVRTADGTQTFAVTSDPTNSAWTGASSGYTLAPGIASLSVPVIAQTWGTSGNVQANAISQLVTAIPGVDVVTNGAPMTNGLDAETDAALRARFQNYVQSRSRATPAAVGYAVSSIQQGLNYTLQENVDTTGASRMGSFVVTVDDGSGYPSASLLATVGSAVDAVRPVGSIFAVQPPSVVIANVSLLIAVAPAVAKPPVDAAVAQAIAAYLNELIIGAPLPLTKLAQLAYSASPAVANVSSIAINAMTQDLTPSISGVIKAGIVAVS